MSLIPFAAACHFLLQLLRANPLLSSYRPRVALLLPLLCPPLLAVATLAISPLLPALLAYLLCVLIAARSLPPAALPVDVLSRADVTLYTVFFAQSCGRNPSTRLGVSIVFVAIAVCTAIAHLCVLLPRLYAALSSVPRSSRALLQAFVPALPSSGPLHDEQTVPPSAYTTSALTLFSFSWMNPTVSTGRERSLEPSDILELARPFRTHTVGAEIFGPRWRAECCARRAPSLSRTLLACFGQRLAFSGVLSLLNECCVFVGPLLLRIIILHLQAREHGGSDPRQGFHLALALFVTYMCETLLSSQLRFITATILIQTRSSLVSAVFEKSCRLSPGGRAQFTEGQIQNLMAIDSSTVATFVFYIHLLWTVPLQIAVAMMLLVNLMGRTPVLAGVLVIIATMPAQAMLVASIKSLREKAGQSTDDRLKSLSEAIKGIKVIKLYASELSVVKRILGVRTEEIGFLRKIAFAQAWSATIMSCLPTTLTIIAFFAYAAAGHPLDAAVVFPAVAVFNIMTPSLLIFPSVLLHAAQAAASMSRLLKFLCAEELESLSEGEHAVDQEELDVSKTDLAAVGASFCWHPSMPFPAPNLSSVSFQIPEGSLVAVVGPTGGGKSTLLAGLLGEVPIVSGKAGIRRDRTVCYCAQVPFVQNASVRDNILFGKSYDEDHYSKTVRACCLLPDFNVLPAGDLTEIGGRGVNLSGGQRVRVSLARAMYSQADICVLDDPLSAVDAHVGKSIFYDGIVSHLRGKTRLLTTNHVHLAASPDVDMVMVVKNGTVLESGSRHSLLSDPDSEFSRLVESAGAIGAGDMQDEKVGDIASEHSFVQDEIQKSAAPSAYADLKGSKQVPNDVSNATSRSSLLGDDGICNYGALEAGQLIQKETKYKGRVQFRHYVTYLRAMGLYRWALPVCLFTLLTQGAGISVNIWLSHWSDESTHLAPGDPARTIFNMIVFGCLGILSVAFASGSAFSIAFGIIRASVVLHEKLLLSVLGAPSSFFHSTPEGRIINRFNSDVDRVDSFVGHTLHALLHLVVSLGSTLLLILWVTPAFIFFVIPIAAMCFYIQEFFRKSSVDLRRLETLACSPLYSHFGETLDGVMTIRAYGNVTRASNTNDALTDELNKPMFSSHSANSWMAVRLQSLGTVLIFGATCLLVLSPAETLSASMSGLVLSYVTQIMLAMTWVVFRFTDAECHLSSVERMSEYSERPFAQEEVGGLAGFLQQRGTTSRAVPSEGSQGLLSAEKSEKLGRGENKSRAKWPKQGEIVFENVEMKYRKDLEPALRSVSFTVAPGEHVGIVGRTGAGKSSAIQCLFRLNELRNGRILIDNVDISGMGLFDLRSSLGIIPQEPVCFSGTIRTNLDMFEEHGDEDVCTALESCGLQHTMKEKVELDFEVAEGGSNLSVGQRQLLCLGRALLRDSQILVLDEATSNVSNAMDEMFHQTLQEKMGHCTILTVAHRLHTVIRHDRIFVMAGGRIVESGKPSELLSRNSLLSDLVAETGPNTASHLRYLASLPRNAPSRTVASSLLQ